MTASIAPLQQHRSVEDTALEMSARLSEFGEGMDPSEFVDRVEEAMVDNFPVIHREANHLFIPGMYIRELTMEAGEMFTSKIHKTEHPYFISEGAVSVWIKGQGVVTLRAPYMGITYPGTRRILYAHTRTVWTTFHTTDKTDLAEIEEELIMKHNNPLLESKGALQ